MLLVDSHCHLNFPEFAEDVEAVLARAREAGVGVMQLISTKMTEFPALLALAEAHPELYCSVGVHPNTEESITKEELIGISSSPKVIGYGETGLDYYREHDKALQKKNFAQHIEAAQDTGIPIIVHTRDAEGDTVSLLQEQMKKKPFTGVIHCFTAGRELAEAVLALGFYISFSGIFTFKNASHLHDIARDIPLDHLLIETDAPYLAPMPHRGKRNEPAFVTHTNAVLAAVKGISAEACAAATSENFFRLFSKAKRPGVM